MLNSCMIERGRRRAWRAACFGGATGCRWLGSATSAESRLTFIALVVFAALFAGCAQQRTINAQETVLLQESPALTLVVRNATPEPLAILAAADDQQAFNIAAGATATTQFTVSSVVRLDRLIKTTRGCLEDTGEARTFFVQSAGDAPLRLAVNGMMATLRARTPAGEIWAYDIELDSCVFDSTSPQARELMIDGPQDLAGPFRWCAEH